MSGPVVAVFDGDTIEVLHNQQPERIRLNGIDCPEKGQAYGHKAKEVASALVFGKTVTLHTHGQSDPASIPSLVYRKAGRRQVLSLSNWSPSTSTLRHLSIAR